MRDEDVNSTVHPSSLSFVYRATASPRATDATLVVRMQRRLIIDRYFLTGANVSERNKENVFVEDLHECIWLARVIDIVGAVSAAAPVQTPTIIDGANTQCLSMRSSVRFGV